MTVQLALYKGPGSFGNAFIRWWTNSQYSHCELVIGDRCYSSSVMDGGVRTKQVGEGDDKISLAPDKWDLITLPWARVEPILEYFEQTDHYRYGWPSLLLSQMFNLNRPITGAQFCSEWCAAALGLPAPSSLSPATLSAWCMHVNSIYA